MICQKHVIVDIDQVNKSNEIIVYAAIHALQILSDESDANDNFAESEVTRRRYWDIRNSLFVTGVDVVYLVD